MSVITTVLIFFAYCIIRSFSTHPTFPKMAVITSVLFISNTALIISSHFTASRAHQHLRESQWPRENQSPKFTHIAKSDSSKVDTPCNEARGCVVKSLACWILPSSTTSGCCCTIGKMTSWSFAFASRSRIKSKPDWEFEAVRQVSSAEEAFFVSLSADGFPSLKRTSSSSVFSKGTCGSTSAVSSSEPV